VLRRRCVAAVAGALTTADFPSLSLKFLTLCKPLFQLSDFSTIFGSTSLLAQTLPQPRLISGRHMLSTATLSTSLPPIHFPLRRRASRNLASVDIGRACDAASSAYLLRIL
jgi:hypothetical protein